MKLFDLNRYKAVKVMFKQPIFEEDFPDKGMTAWLIDIVEMKEEGHYELHFNFEDFEEENKKYFKEVFFGNQHTLDAGLRKGLYTALESGNYNPMHRVYWGDTSWTKGELNCDLEKYLIIISED